MADIWIVMQGTYDVVAHCAFSTEEGAQHYADLRNMESNEYYVDQVPLDPPITFDKWEMTAEEAERRLAQIKEEKAQKEAEDARREAERIANMRKWEAQERREGRMTPVCDCIASGNPNKPKQHGADPHAKNCAIYRRD